MPRLPTRGSHVATRILNNQDATSLLDCVDVAFLPDGNREQRRHHYAHRHRETLRLVLGRVVPELGETISAVKVRSAGSVPADSINPTVRESTLEANIDLSTEEPKILTTDAVQTSDVVITMGCDDACPIYPGKRYRDWALAEPAGQSLDPIRPIRDGTERRDAPRAPSRY